MAFADIPRDVRNKMVEALQLVLMFGNGEQQKMADNLILSLTPRYSVGKTPGYTYIPPITPAEMKLYRQNRLEAVGKLEFPSDAQTDAMVDSIEERKRELGLRKPRKDTPS